MPDEEYNRRYAKHCTEANDWMYGVTSAGVNVFNWRDLEENTILGPFAYCGNHLDEYLNPNATYEDLVGYSENVFNSAAMIAGGYKGLKGKTGKFATVENGANRRVRKGNVVDKVDDISKGVRQPVSVNANEIRFSQSSVNGAEEIIISMKVNGWKGDPIDVIRMSDGKMTTIDNTRVVAAREAGIDVQAIIHDANEILPESLIDRFTTKKGVPKTWGEAIELRIGKQKASFRNNNPFGADTMERIGK